MHSLDGEQFDESDYEILDRMVESVELNLPPGSPQDSPGENPVPQAGQSPEVTEMNPCEWMLDAALLRHNKNEGGAGFVEFYKRHGLEGFESDDEAIIEELLAAIDEFVPSLRVYISELKRLPVHPDGASYLENELEAMQLMLAGLEAVRTGLTNEDDKLYLEGVELLVQYGVAAQKADTEALNLRSACAE